MLPNQFAFVDIETTGGSVTHDRIIELGLLRVENGVVTDTYETLINPQTYVSPFIEDMTGIHQEELVSAPLFEEVKDTFLRLMEGCVFVAHNVRFDYSFIKNELRRLGISFSPHHLCTVKLSRYLYPQHKRHNLSSIIERHNLQCSRRHRAFDDAKAIFDFYTLSKKAIPEKKFTQAITAILKRPSLPIGLSEDQVESLPDSPGVYIFYSEEKIPLYVGKSINIRDRVLSHFSGDHLSTKEMNMCQQVRSIESVNSGGELSALVRESMMIKQLQPLYNRMLRLHKKMVLAVETTVDEYKAVIFKTVSQIDEADKEHVVGVFRSLKQAKESFEELAKKHSLCKKLLHIEKTRNGCFGYKLGWCKGACMGKESALQYNMRHTIAFSALKIKKWPFPGPILIREENEQAGLTESFLIDRWTIQKILRNDQENTETMVDTSFNLDVYKILSRYVFDAKHQKNIHVVSHEDTQTGPLADLFLSGFDKPNPFLENFHH